MRFVAIATLVAVPFLASCESQVYEPAKCDYEQAQWTEPAVRPMERAEWVDYNDDGVVVLCMWVG
jgi:hypothetical protein